MVQTLLTMEKNFFKFQYTSDKKWLNSVLHDSFLECGQSGMLFDKKTTIDALLSYTSDRKIEIYNFECNPIRHDCWMIHYFTKSDETVTVYRTSVWVRETQCQLLFHQATPFHGSVKLTLC